MVVSRFDVTDGSVEINDEKRTAINDVSHAKLSPAVEIVAVKRSGLRACESRFSETVFRCTDAVHGIVSNGGSRRFTEHRLFLARDM